MLPQNYICGRAVAWEGSHGEGGEAAGRNRLGGSGGGNGTTTPCEALLALEAPATAAFTTPCLIRA